MERSILQEQLDHAGVDMSHGTDRKFTLIARHALTSTKKAPLPGRRSFFFCCCFGAKAYAAWMSMKRELPSPGPLGGGPTDAPAGYALHQSMAPCVPKHPELGSTQT